MRLMFAQTPAPWTECQRISQLRIFTEETLSHIARIKKEGGTQKKIRLDRERQLYALIVNELRQRQSKALRRQMQVLDYSPGY